MPDITGQAVDFGLGMLTNAADRVFQIGQQQRLTNQQVKAMKQMGQFNYEKQMQLWRETNYPAQVGMMKEAGLNPALMYKGSGAGGTTAFMGGGGVTGGTAGMELGNAVMQRAQIRLMESQANKLDVEAKKTGGVDTELVQMQIKDLAQKVTNESIKERLLLIDEEIMQVENHIKGMTQNSVISEIQNRAANIKEQLNQMEVKTEVDRATKDEAIAIAEKQLIKIGLENALLAAQEDSTRENIKLTQVQIDQVIRNVINAYQDNIRQWRRLRVEELKYDLEKDIQQWKELMPPGLDNIVSGVIGGVIGGKGAGAATEIKGFHKR